MKHEQSMSNRRGCRQTGYSVLELLVGGFVVAVVALSGSILWHRHAATPRGAHSSSTPTVRSGHGDIDEPSTAPTAGAQPSTQLFISPWGIRVPLSADLQGDIVYGIRPHVLLSRTQDATPVYGQVAYFASKKLAANPAQPNYCGLRGGAQNDQTGASDPDSYEGGPGVFLERSTTRLQPALDTDIYINSYWYRPAHGSAMACFAGSDGTQEAAFIQSTLTALRSIAQ